MKKEYQNYIFDFYGTLADIRTDEENPRVWECFANYLKRMGMDTEGSSLRERYFRLCRSDSERSAVEGARRRLEGPYEIDLLLVWQALGQELGVSLSRQQSEELSLAFRALSLERLRLYHGARDLLHTLRVLKKRVVLLSNAQASFTLQELKVLELDNTFDAVLLSSDAGVKKPSRSFFALLQQMGFRAEESVMIGNDLTCDCQGAASVGMDSFYIHTEQSPNHRRVLPRGCKEIFDLSEVL